MQENGVNAQANGDLSDTCKEQQQISTLVKLVTLFLCRKIV